MALAAGRAALCVLLAGRCLHPLADAPPVREMLPDAWRIPLGNRVLRALEGSVPPPAPVVPDAAVTSGRGWRRDPFTGRHALHEGVDLAVAPGSLVRSPADALVLSAGYRPGYGETVELALGRRCRVLLAHLDKTAVSGGEIVPRGWPVGWSGSSGRSTGPHLHFEHRCGARVHLGRR